MASKSLHSAGSSFLRIALSAILVVGLMPSTSWAQVTERSKSASPVEIDNAAALEEPLEDSVEAFAEEASAPSEPQALSLTGSGTASDPYVIQTASQLTEAAGAINTDTEGTYNQACYRLSADIEVSDNWEPIGKSSTYPFKGTFDGNGHTVTVQINTASSYQGLFGYIADAAVKNVTVKGTIAAYRYVAGVVGYAKNSSITNAHNQASVTAVTDRSGYYSYNFAGVVGMAESCKIVACSNQGTITHAGSGSTTKGYGNTAGICGYLNGGTISSCYNSGLIHGTTVKNAGIVADVKGAVTIESCYNTGNVAYEVVSSDTETYGASYDGGIVAYADLSTITVSNCYNTGSVTTVSTTSSNISLGGIFGYINGYISNYANLANNYYLQGSAPYAFGSPYSSYRSDEEGKGEACTSDQMMAASFADLLGNNFLADDAGTYNGGLPYLRWQNQAMNYRVDFSVALENTYNNDSQNAIELHVYDADGSEITLAPGTNTPENATWEAGEFSNGTCLSYVVAKRGYETVQGELEIDCESVAQTIALVPQTYTQTVVVGPANAQLAFTVKHEGQSSASSVEPSSKTTDEAADTCTYTFAGLYNHDSLHVSVGCYGFESIGQDLPSLDFADGEATVTLGAKTSFAANMSVTIPEGLSSESSNPVVIVYCRDEASDYYNTVVYDSREATAPTREGNVCSYGIAGLVAGEYSYMVYLPGCETSRATFEVESSDQAISVVLERPSGAWEGNVDLAWYTIDPNAEEFHIATASQLAGFSQLVAGAATDETGGAIAAQSFAGKTVYLDADIDLGGNLETPQYWTPIGKQGSSATAAGVFSGVFDGLGHAISNMRIGQDQTNRLHSVTTATGLFSSIQGTSSTLAGVRNLTLANGIIEETDYKAGNSYGTGMVAGNAGYAQFDHVNVESGAVRNTKGYQVGGIVGRITAGTMLQNCSNAANIYNVQYDVGGIVGSVSGTCQITRCTNSGAVAVWPFDGGTSYTTVVAYGAGGIVGAIASGSSNATRVTECVNTGLVNAKVASVGGIVGCAGSSSGTTVTPYYIGNCYNRGKVFSQATTYSSSSYAAQGDSAGGIIGYANIKGATAPQVENCYSEAEVSITDEIENDRAFAGGVVGFIWGADVRESVAFANNFSDGDVTPGYSIGHNYAESEPAGYEGIAEMISASDLCSEDMPARLGSAFAKDTAGINDGFPILRWQNANTAWDVDFCITLDTPANDDFVVTGGQVATQGTLPTLAVYDASGNAVELADAVAVAVEPDGTYRFEAKAALVSGSYSYVVCKRGYNETASTEGDGSYVSCYKGTFEVAEEDTSVACELTATRYTYTLKIADPDDGPLSDASFTLRQDDEQGAIIEPDSFDVEAAVATYHLYNGQYWARVGLYGYTPRQTAEGDLAISYADLSTNVTLEPLSQMSLAFDVSASEGAYDDGVVVMSLSCPDKDFGTFELLADQDGVARYSTDVPTGTYSYVVRAGGFEKQEGTIELAEDTTVSLTLEPAQAWDGSEIDTGWYEASASDLYISTGAELAGLAAIVNGTAKEADGDLLQDDFEGKTVHLLSNIALGGHNWTPIGVGGMTVTAAFRGTFDGGGKMVNGLSIEVNSSSVGAAALFGAVGSNASICDLTVQGRITGTAKSLIFAASGVVAVADVNSDLVLKNVGNRVAIDIDASASTVAYEAGLVGWCKGSAKFSGCFNQATQKLTVKNFGYAGGLLAMSNGGLIQVDSSYNTAAVELLCLQATTNLYAGGIAGSVGSNEIHLSNCYSAGSVSAVAAGEQTANQGAFVGSNSFVNSYLKQSLWLEGSAPAAVGSFAGTNAVQSVTSDELSADSAVTYLDAGLDGEEEAVFQRGTLFPVLSWEREIASVEVLTMPDKTAYSDQERFDATGLTLKVSFTSGSPLVVDSGWIIRDGNSLAPTQTSVTIEYAGWRFAIPISVTQIEHETPQAISLQLAGPVVGETPDNVAITSKSFDTFTANAQWTKAGQPFEGSFAGQTFYRATVQVDTYYVDGDAWYVLPEDVQVTITGADGTPSPLEVLYAKRSDDGRSYTLECTYQALDDTSGITPTATHLYYEGDAQAKLYNAALEASPALTIAIQGEDEPIDYTLADLEQAALTGQAPAIETTVASRDGAAWSASAVSGIKLYEFLAGQIPASLGDDTPIAFVGSDGSRVELTVGDIRMPLRSYDESGVQTGTVAWMLAFGQDATPLLPSSELLDSHGPLQIVGGQVSSEAACTRQNVVRIEVGEIVPADTRVVSFSAYANNEKLAQSLLNVEVFDGFGNKVASENARAMCNVDESYTYVATVEGYTAKTGSFTVEDKDNAIRLDVQRVYNGTPSEPSKAEDGAYEIYTPEELFWWIQNAQVDDNVRLMADVALNDGLTWDKDKSNLWPVEKFGATEDSAFTGTFDGQGHTIYGLYIYRENLIDLWIDWSGDVGMISDNVSQIGLFGYATDATIKNLGVEGRIDVLDRPDSMLASWMQIGGIVGYGTRVTIENCVSNIGVSHVQANTGGSVGGVSKDGFPQYQDAYVGALAGTVANSTVTNCYGRGVLYTEGSRTNSAGGLIGQVRQYSQNTSTVSNCFATTQIVCKPAWPSTNYVSHQGGVVGATTGTAAITGCVGLNASISGGGADKGSVAARVVASSAAEVSGCLGYNGMSITGASRTLGEACEGADVSNAAATAGATYKSLGWVENNDATVTSDSQGWQFGNTYPRLYWEDATKLLEPAQSANTVEVGDGSGASEGEGTFNEYAPPATYTLNVQVEGHSARQAKVYSSKELLAMMTHQTMKLSGYTYYQAYGRAATGYIPFGELFEDAGLPLESGDALVMGGMTLDYDNYFATPRYYFPYWADGESTDAKQVPTSLIVKSYGGSSYYTDEMLDIAALSADYLYAYMACFGQTTPYDQNVSGWIYQQTEGTILYEASSSANSYVADLLDDCIATASQELADTLQGGGPSDVQRGIEFVTPEAASALEAAISAARLVAADPATTNDSAMTAVEALEAALDAFRCAKQVGTKEVSFAGFVVAIQLGEEFLAAVSAGDIVVAESEPEAVGQEWVESEVYRELCEALNFAKTVNGDAYLDQVTVDGAEVRLTAALQAFEDGIRESGRLNELVVSVAKSSADEELGVQTFQASVANASGSDIAYRWQYSPDGTTWKYWMGAEDATLDVALWSYRIGYSVRAVAIASDGRRAVSNVSKIGISDNEILESEENVSKLRGLMSIALAVCIASPSVAWGEVIADATKAQSEEAEPAIVETDTGAAYRGGQIIIAFDNAQDGSSSLGSMSVENVTQKLESEGIEVEEELSQANAVSGDIVLAEVTDGKSVDEAIEAAEMLPGVAWAQPNYRYEALGEEEEISEGEFIRPIVDSVITPLLMTDDPAANVYDTSVAANQYYLYGEVGSIKGANVIEAWDWVTCDHTQTIAILDTGCNLTHEDLADNILADLAYDMYNDKKLEASGTFNGDYYGHGTHCCGIAAGCANNGVGIAGASYNASILPIKVFDDSSSDPGAYTSTIVSAYQYLFDLIDEGEVSNLHVISMSLGGYGSPDSDDRALEALISEGREEGIISVCAGGNGDSNNEPYTTEMYPSDFPESFSVTALEYDGGNCNWSDYNECKDISAPGYGIYSTYRTSSNSYARMSGTSMATPLVAGICALLWAADPTATVDEVEEAIKSTADPIDDPDDKYDRWPNKTGSAGAINAAAAVNALAGVRILAPEGFSSVCRTQSVQLTAEILGVDAQVNWTWSVEDGTGTARISSTGLLTGITAGTVSVSVSGEYDGRTFEAHRYVTIDEIAIPAAPAVSSGYADAITVSWTAASSAVAYDVQRAKAGEEFVTVARIESTDESTYTYVDSASEAATTYRYRVVPLGMLDGEYVEGAPSSETSGVRFAMESELANQAEAVDATLAHAAYDGKTVDTVVVTSDSNAAVALIASGLAGAVDASIVTTPADTLDEYAASALSVVNPVCVYVVGNEDEVSDAVVEQISSFAPRATVTRFGDASLNKIAESVYLAGKGSWGDTAFVVSSHDADGADALSAVAYAYGANAPVFATNSLGALSVTTRQNMMSGAFSNVIVLGDTGMVGSTVMTQIANLGLTAKRIAGKNVYDASKLINTEALESGALTNSVYVFAGASISGAVGATNLAGYLGVPVMIADTNHEDALENVIGNATEPSPVVLYNGGVMLSSEEKSRLTDYVRGATVQPIVKDEVDEKIDLVGAQIAKIAMQKYIGSAIEPEVQITFEGKQLKRGVDFEVFYKDNVDEGIATATIYGVGEYTGVREATYKIAENVVVVDDFTVGSTPFVNVKTDEGVSARYLVAVKATVEPGMVPALNGVALVTDGSCWYALVDADTAAALSEYDIDAQEGDAVSFTRGDVTMNGLTNIVDAQAAYDIACGSYALGTAEEALRVEQFISADVNNDACVDANDARAIQYLVLYPAA